MEEVGLWDVAYDTTNMLKHFQSSVDMARGEFSISCLGVAIAKGSVYLVIHPGVLLVSRDIISLFVLWTLAPKTEMPLMMM